jgi:hypothetical protein
MKKIVTLLLVVCSIMFFVACSRQVQGKILTKKVVTFEDVKDFVENKSIESIWSYLGVKPSAQFENQESIYFKEVATSENFKVAIIYGYKVRYYSLDRVLIFLKDNNQYLFKCYTDECEMYGPNDRIEILKSTTNEMEFMVHADKGSMSGNSNLGTSYMRHYIDTVYLYKNGKIYKKDTEDYWEEPDKIIKKDK